MTGRGGFPLSEVAHEGCECGDYKHTPRTWSAMRKMGHIGHLPHRLGGCAARHVVQPLAQEARAQQMDEEQIDKHVAEVSATVEARKAPEEKKMEMQQETRKQEAVVNGAHADGPEPIPQRRKAAIEVLVIETRAGKRPLKLRDGQVTLIALAHALQVSPAYIYKMARKGVAKMWKETESGRYWHKGVNITDKEGVQRFLAEVLRREREGGVGSGTLHHKYASATKRRRTRARPETTANDGRTFAAEPASQERRRRITELRNLFDELGISALTYDRKAGTFKVRITVETEEDFQ